MGTNMTLVEPVLEDDVALINVPDDNDHKIEQLSDADMDSFLEAYRASQDELLGRVPLPSPSSTALAGRDQGRLRSSPSPTS